MSGVDPHEALAYRDYLLAGGVTTVVEALTGSPAESFETTARRYAALPFARATRANRLKAVARFAAAPLWPGVDLDRYARVRALPAPPAPRLAVHDAGWRDTHGPGARVAAAPVLAAPRPASAA